jgi:multimeric flavodoxin WrbA
MTQMQTEAAIKILGIESSPRSKNSQALFDSLSGIMLQGILEIASESSDVTTERINLSACRLNPCRGCFSDMETRCHFLCDYYEDDFRWIARKMMAADAVVFATPTYMGGMSAVLKMFFERWISFKAPRVDSSKTNKSLEECFALMRELADGKRDISNPLQGKVGAVVVAGSEIGQANTIKDIMYILNLYGFILPPQGFVYHTGHSMQPLEDVRRCFFENSWLQATTVTIARAMVQLIRATKPQAWVQMQHTLESS